MTDEPSTPRGVPTPPRRRRASVPVTAETPAPVGDAAGVQALAADVAAVPAPPVPGVTQAPLVGPTPVAVEFRRGAVGGIRAQDVHVRSGVVGGVAGEHASVEMGIVGGIAAREASVSQGVVRTVLAQDVRIEQSVVRTVVANQVQAGPTTAIAFVIARQVDGNARILFDWRGTLALAVVFGALAAVFRLRRR